MTLLDIVVASSVILVSKLSGWAVKPVLPV